MFYVYILRFLIYHDQIYIGFTTHLSTRLKEHNSEKCDYTEKYKPWKIIMYPAFKSKIKAMQSEKYFKTASGKSFIKKRFL
jgi:putative endonuclease